MNTPKKFLEILKRVDGKTPDREFPFGVLDLYLPDHDRIFCEEMVRQGKLASFPYCSDDGSNDGFGFKTSNLFYERGISIARRKVYSFRLPFFGANVSFEHGKKVEFQWRGVKASGVSKEIAEAEAKTIISNLFKFYISFIRSWIAKGFLPYEDAYTILEHYSKNDGIVTIPEFMEAKFKKSLDSFNIIDIKARSLTGDCLQDIADNFMIHPVCLNDSIAIVECPFCLTQATSEGEIIKCSNCGKEFIGA
jgi:hypothetical protein